MSTFVQASHVPLFDRLAGGVPDSPDGRLLDASGLRVSLRQDLLRLMNVRNSLTIEQFLASEGSVVHYGLPDLLALSPQSDRDLDLLARVLAHALALFEPRLSGVQVRMEATAGAAARAHIIALAAMGRQLKPVDFEIALDEAIRPAPEPT